MPDLLHFLVRFHVAVTSVVNVNQDGDLPHQACVEREAVSSAASLGRVLCGVTVPEGHEQV